LKTAILAQLWQTNTSILLPPVRLPQRKHRAAFDDLVAGLRYGSVCINVPTLIGFATTKLTWGAFLPGGTPQASMLAALRWAGGACPGCMQWSCATVGSSFCIPVCKVQRHATRCPRAKQLPPHLPHSARRTLAPATARCTTRCCWTTCRKVCCARPGASTQCPSGAVGGRAQVLGSVGPNMCRVACAHPNAVTPALAHLCCPACQCLRLDPDLPASLSANPPSGRHRTAIWRPWGGQRCASAPTPPCAPCCRWQGRPCRAELAAVTAVQHQWKQEPTKALQLTPRRLQQEQAAALQA